MAGLLASIAASCETDPSHEYCYECAQGTPTTPLGGGTGGGDVDLGDSPTPEVTATPEPTVTPIPGSIDTVAGTGDDGFSGDGDAATEAELSAPAGVAYDTYAGVIYIADTENNRIRKIDRYGEISTVAGTGSADYSGDGGAATKAELHSPLGVAVDPVGVVYVADTGNHRIRTISDGEIATFAGTGVYGLSGDNANATNAQLASPAGVAVDADGVVYISDTGNDRIRAVRSGIISTYAGIGRGFGGDGGPATLAQLYAPSQLVVSDGGALFFADTGNLRVRRVSVDGTIATVAGGGLLALDGDGIEAVFAALEQPVGVTFDADGLLVFSDASLHQLWRLELDGILTLVAGDGTAGNSGDGGDAVDARLSAPRGVSTNAYGSIFVACAGSHNVRVIAPLSAPSFAR